MRRCPIFTREKKRLLFPFTTHPVKKAFEVLRRACRGKAPPSANADRSAA